MSILERGSLPVIAGPVVTCLTCLVDFEWDEDKNQENIRKHGFDFGDAWEIFEAPLLEALDTRAHYSEDRWTGIGLLGNRVVVVTYTSRGANTYALSPCERH